MTNDDVGEYLTMENWRFHRGKNLVSDGIQTHDFPNEPHLNQVRTLPWGFSASFWALNSSQSSLGTLKQSLTSSS